MIPLNALKLNLELSPRVRSKKRSITTNLGSKMLESECDIVIEKKPEHRASIVSNLYQSTKRFSLVSFTAINSSKQIFMKKKSIFLPAKIAKINKRLAKIKSAEELLGRLRPNMIENGSIFTTEDITKKKNRYKHKNLIKKKIQKLTLNFINALNNQEPNNDKKKMSFEELCKLFDENRVNNKCNKKKMSKRQHNFSVLNKLYGNTPEYIGLLENAKNKKYLSLEKYQENILRAFNSDGQHYINIGDLYWKLKNVRINSQSVSPFPKINIKNIVNHIKNPSKIKNTKLLKLKDFMKKVNEPKDEFEKEEKIINDLKCLKNNVYLNYAKKDNSLKILDALPPYLKFIFLSHREDNK